MPSKRIELKALAKLYLSHLNFLMSINLHKYTTKENIFSTFVVRWFNT